MRKLFSSSFVILALRILLLALAGGAVVTGFVMTRGANPRMGDTRVLYVCPMHPDVVAPAPGDCPICRMELEPKGVQSTTGLPAQTGPTDAGDAPPTTFVLPAGAEIQTFEEIGYGKLYETTYEMRAPAWVETREMGVAQLHRDEIALLEPTEAALFYPSSRPKNGTSPGIRVRRIDEPPSPWDAVTSRVRFRVDTTADLTPNQTGWLKFATRVRMVPSVRASAVIQSAKGSYVLLVAKDNRTLTQRPVEIGSVLYGHAAILSGLAVGERVATLNTFFLDAERRFSGGLTK